MTAVPTAGRFMQLDIRRVHFPRIPRGLVHHRGRIWRRSRSRSVSVLPVLGYRVTIKHLGLYQPASNPARRGEPVRTRCSRVSAEVWLIDFFPGLCSAHTTPFYRANPDGGLKVIQDRISARRLIPCSLYCHKVF